MRRPIVHGRHTVEDDDVVAVARALRSDSLIEGPLVGEFENAIKTYTGAKHALICSSGRAALLIACLATDMLRGDSVLTTPLANPSLSGAVLHAGAVPVFADIDPDTLGMGAEEIEKKVRYNPSVRALIAVHYEGVPCDMELLSRVARENGLYLIEDASHGLGGSWKDSTGAWHRVGSSAFSHMTVLSFSQDSSITTGEGGAVTTNDGELYERLKLLRDNFADGAMYGLNEPPLSSTLSEIQCALGLSQLNKLDRFVSRRAEIAELYSAMLLKYPFIKTLPFNENRVGAYHSYPVRIPFDEIKVDRKEWLGFMKKIGIRLMNGGAALHMQPYYQKAFGYGPGDYPEAESFLRESVGLPVYPLLTDEEAGAVVEGIVSTLAFAAASSARHGNGFSKCA